MVIVIAPVAEEIFFRGFFYRALRSRFTIAGAATIDGLLFGVIHYDFSGAEALLILPPLAALGIVFCLVYERTGSLFAVIALHALVNTFGYLAVAKNSVYVALGFGLAMLAACIVVPRVIGRGPPRAEAFASA
jgi:membrane protease YdiL (CAAX protease family)